MDSGSPSINPIPVKQTGLPPLTPLPPAQKVANAPSIEATPSLYTFDHAYGKNTYELKPALSNLPSPASPEDVRLMKNLIFAPMHKAYTKEKNATTGGRDATSADFDGDWSILPGILRDGTKQARSIVPYLRVHDDKATIVLAVWGAGSQSTTPDESPRLSRVFDFKGSHASALLGHVKLFHPSKEHASKQYAPDLVDHDAKYVLAHMSGNNLNLHCGERDDFVYGDLYLYDYVNILIEKISKAKDFGVSLLVVSGGIEHECKQLRMAMRPSATADPIPINEDCAAFDSLRHYAPLCGLATAFYAGIDKIIAARFKGPVPVKAPAPAPAPAPPSKKTTIVKALPKSSAVPPPTKKRPADVPQLDGGSKKKKKKDELVDSDEEEEDGDEDSLSGSGSDDGDSGSSEESSESEEVDDSSESEAEESDDAEGKQQPRLTKRKIDAIGRNIAAQRKQPTGALVKGHSLPQPAPQKPAESVAARDEDEDEDDDEDDTTDGAGMPSMQGSAAKDTKRKPAKSRRQATERLCNAAMEQIQALMDVVPLSAQGRLQDKLNDLSHKMKPFVEFGKVLQGGKVMEAQIALVGELATLVAKMGAADASRGPDVKASRDLGLKAAKLWVDQRSKFSALNDVLGQWAGTVAEMNAAMLRVAQDLDRTSSNLTTE